MDLMHLDGRVIKKYIIMCCSTWSQLAMSVPLRPEVHEALQEKPVAGFHDNELRRAPISDCSSLFATCHPRLTSWKPPTWKIFGREVSSRKVEASQPNEYNPCLTVSDLIKGWSPA